MVEASAAVAAAAARAITIIAGGFVGTIAIIAGDFAEALGGFKEVIEPLLLLGWSFDVRISGCVIILFVLHGGHGWAGVQVTVVAIAVGIGDWGFWLWGCLQRGGVVLLKLQAGVLLLGVVARRMGPEWVGLGLSPGILRGRPR